MGDLDPSLLHLPCAYTPTVRARALAVVRDLLAGKQARLPRFSERATSARRVGELELYYGLAHAAEAPTGLEKDERAPAASDASLISSVFRRSRRRGLPTADDRPRRLVPDVLHLLLGHTICCLSWQEQQLCVDEAERKPTTACIIELLLCLGLSPDGEAATRMGLMHMLASGGCEPDVWDDTPDPLPPSLQRRLLALCALCGAHIELRDRAHRA